MSRSMKVHLGASLLVALVGCSELPDGAERLTYRREGDVTTTVTLLETPQGIIGRAELAVAVGTTLHAYSETEFTSGVHEAFFALEDTSTRIPDLTGPTTQTFTLGPLPPGSKSPCYSLGFAASSGYKGPELLELSGCAKVRGG